VVESRGVAIGLALLKSDFELRHLCFEPYRGLKSDHQIEVACAELFIDCYKSVGSVTVCRGEGADAATLELSIPWGVRSTSPAAAPRRRRLREGRAPALQRRSAQMPILLVDCPYTHRKFSSGIETLAC
jgi:hypothetical protein